MEYQCSECGFGIYCEFKYCDVPQIRAQYQCECGFGMCCEFKNCNIPQIRAQYQYEYGFGILTFLK